MLNAKEIRSRLRHGDVKRIADALDVDQRIVSEVFHKGWHPTLKNAVLNEALKIIEEEYQGQAELIERAEELDLRGASFSVPTKYKKSKRKDPQGSAAAPIIIFFGIIGLILWFLVPGFKDKIKSMLHLSNAGGESPA